MINKLLNCRGRVLNISQPLVMGILNVTPDSFFDGGKFNEESTMLKQVEEMLQEGAAIIDIGAVSTRPGANEISEAADMKSLITAVKLIQHTFPSAVLSVV